MHILDKNSKYLGVNESSLPFSVNRSASQNDLCLSFGDVQGILLDTGHGYRGDKI